VIKIWVLIVIIIISLGDVAKADSWYVASDIDQSPVSFGMSSGPLAENELAMFFIPVRLAEWVSIVPYVALLRAPEIGIEGYGYGGTVRLQTPFGNRGYRVSYETSFGALKVGESQLDVEEGLRGHYMMLAGPEFQIWNRLTISTSIGWAGVLGDVDEVYPGRINFTAQTAFRWYL
jgi:hypothetical protein